MKNLDVKDSANGAVPGVHVWLVLAKTTRALAAEAARSIAGLGMCPSDFGALEVLLHKGPLAVNTLGSKLLLTSGSATTAVDRLEKRGLVERRNDPDDRRARMVCLTPAGRRLIRNAFASHAADMEKMVSVLTAAERSALVASLKKLGKGEV
jgi:MarR family 2-MHQ and catechol resistance regulon transcriptional repressor